MISIYCMDYSRYFSTFQRQQFNCYVDTSKQDGIILLENTARHML